MYPDEYRYSKEHEWVKFEGRTATVGITDHAQQELGDIVYLELPEAGRKLDNNEVFGTVESVKAVSELFSPLAGEVVESNQDAVDAPEKANEDPHGTGWLIKLQIEEGVDLSHLMDAAAYQSYIAAEKS